MSSLLRLTRRPPAARRPKLPCCSARHFHSFRPLQHEPIRPDVPDVKPARTRFAPSPTGFMHLGSLRTALYNYLFAKHTAGQFILRIEDTDQKRTVEGAEENIMETLRWAGLQWDEGPEVGGSYGPYKQSKRTALYRSHAEQLLLDGAAYRCFCGPHRLEALATTRQAAGLPVEYDRRCHNLTSSESDQRAASGEAHVVRLLAPETWPGFKDEVHGRIQYGANSRAQAEGSFEDPILLKSDGSPTYHLANVVDDHFMDITHVIRGTEWMPSTPKHAFLYRAFGWQPPKWVHVGLLMGKDKQKLSKRNGSVMVSEYRDRGYSPEALTNFVALLGWSHGGGGKSDVMTMDQLADRFSIEGLTAGNTIVNSEKLPFLQKAHLRKQFEENRGTEEVEVEKVEKEVRALYGDKLETGEPITTDYIRAVLKADVKNYLNPHDFAQKSNYFFTTPTFDSKESLKAIVNFRKVTGLSTAELYYGFTEEVERTPEWTLSALKDLQHYGRDLDEETWAHRMRLLRIGVCGGRSGPSMAETMLLLGRARVAQRMRDTDAAFAEYKGPAAPRAAGESGRASGAARKACGTGGDDAEECGGRGADGKEGV
ncbi:glutamyl-tRNA synthetase [Morchella snyderi]|nr:glutamyl-tRNA synthetase [Morchella snyderi]